MKSRAILGVLLIILGVLIAAGPFTIFPVCGDGLTARSGGKEMSAGGEEAEHVDEAASEDITIGEGGAMSKPMACHYTAVTELYIGIGIVVAGVLLIALKKKLVRAWLSVFLGLAGIFELLVPTVLIGVCGSTKMSCHVLTLPALIIFSSVVIAFGVLNAIHLFSQSKKEEQVK